MTHKRQGAARNRESGFALLLILAMAAVLAITLYTQIPRVAFEAQRDKEQLLIDRGEQYSRAIQLFEHKFRRFPATMEELENTNNQRFLRRRYADPMTGKPDWRILHAGPGGVIIDSVNTKKPDATTLQNSNVMTTLGSMTTVGGAADPTAGNGVNLAMRQRPSDAGGAPGDVNNMASNMPGVFPTNVNGPVTVLPDGRIVPLSSVQGGSGSTAGGPSGVAGIPGVIGATGAPLPGDVAIQQNVQNLNGQSPNLPPLPAQVGLQPGNASDLINSLLRSPRPGGMGGIQGMTGATSTGIPPVGGTGISTTTAPQQQVIGAGIAGVASKREQEGIKLYNDHSAYNEWEFIFDVTKENQNGAGRGGLPTGTGTPNQNGQMGQPGVNGAPPPVPGGGRGGVTSPAQ